MKKITKINIPVGKIAATGLAVTGVCTSIAIDNVLKKDTESPKAVKELGRSGMTIIVDSMFLGLAAAAWNDKKLNIEIPINKNNAPRKKDIKRFTEALDLWEAILDGAMAVDHYSEEPELFNAYEDYINEFNKLMKKLSKRIGFKFNPIDVTIENLHTHIIDISKDINNIMSGISTDYFKIVTINESNTNNGNSSSKEIIRETNDYSSSTETTEETVQKKSNNENKTISIELAHQMLNIFNDKNIDVSESYLEELLNNKIDTNINSIIKKYYDGEITVMDTRDRLLAYLLSIVQDDEDDEITIDKNDEETSKDSI